MEKDHAPLLSLSRAKLPRRADIDLLRIVLSWAVLLYHTVLVFTPSLPYYVKIYPPPTRVVHLHVEDCSEDLLCQQSYAIKNQLGHPKHPPCRFFIP